MFDKIRSIEKAIGATSTFNFYAGKKSWYPSVREWLLDPGYNIHEKRLVNQLANLQSEVHIGLHPSYDAWRT